MRIVCFYLDDVQTLSEAIKGYFHPIEEQAMVPDTEDKFGYFGQHYILLLPEDVVEEPVRPNFFELQIKTLFQHAWSEANHDLLYKPLNRTIIKHQRRIAFTAAQAWGSDQIFNELFLEATNNDSMDGE